MADDMHGGSCIFVRREAFLSVGGFTEFRGVGFEDYEFHVRCNLEGIRWDVLPEMIYRYRMGSPESLSQSTPRYKNLARVRKLYEEHLRGSRLEQLPLAVAAAYWRNEATGEREAALERTVVQRHPKLPASTHGLRLLLLTCYFPFGSMSGWHKRVQAMIRYFSSRCELTLVAPVPPNLPWHVRREALRHLHLVRGVMGGCPISAPGDFPLRVHQLYVNSVQAALRALPTGDYHAALIDQIFLAEFRHDIETTPVLMEQNIESSLLRQAAAHSCTIPLPEPFQDAHVEAERFEQYENRTWPDFPVRAVVSEVDRAQMDHRCSTGRTVVAPNGADLSTWLPGARHDTGTVLYPAYFPYFPNVDAVQFLVSEIWPHVRKRKPAARLIIAGRDPDDSVKALVSAAHGVELVPNPKSMARVAKRASILVAPLRLGSGTRIKILESMAWGLPVVSTTLGFEGIAASDGQHLLVRDEPQEFAEAICLLMSDAVLWRKLRYAGRDLVQERYSWDRVFEPLEKALIELVS
jgi:glycosyltransferase involved in cell wall biosynthesis